MKSLEVLNMNQNLDTSPSDHNGQTQVDSDTVTGKSETPRADGQYGQDSSINEIYKHNELFKFLKYNESGFNNMVVYLFWIVISDWFNDNDNISFPHEFITEVRHALTE